MPLTVGEKAPPFELPASTGQHISLQALASKTVVLYFYPRDDTPGCTTEACDFRDSLSSLNAAGVGVIGISPDPPAKLVQFRERDGLTFPLLSDQDHDVMTAYGVWGEKKLYGKTVTGVIRSTFVVGPDGSLEQAMYNVKATGHVAKVRRELGIP